MPEKAAAVGQVSTHWPMRVSSCFISTALPMANMRMATPGRPSGVWSGVSSFSMPASTPQPMTEVAKPVMALAAL
jgi:hypothetical protein